MTNATSNLDDYELDVRFGLWLKEAREKAGLSLTDAARTSRIPEARLKSLEVGYADRGITRRESESLCVVYKVPLENFLRQAAGL